MIKEDLPLHFGMALAMDQEALERYAQMSKRKKNALIKKSQEIDSHREMERFVNRIGNNNVK